MWAPLEPSQYNKTSSWWEEREMTSCTSCLADEVLFFTLLFCLFIIWIDICFVSHSTELCFWTLPVTLCVFVWTRCVFLVDQLFCHFLVLLLTPALLDNLLFLTNLIHQISLWLFVFFEPHIFFTCHLFTLCRGDSSEPLMSPTVYELMLKWQKSSRTHVEPCVLKWLYLYSSVHM